jgi:hypothetical protein
MAPTVDSLITKFLPVVEQVAQTLEGTEFAAAAEQDVQNVTGLLSKHLAAADAELVSWWMAVRHPAAAAQNPATPTDQG